MAGLGQYLTLSFISDNWQHPERIQQWELAKFANQWQLMLGVPVQFLDMLV
ncbi:hypothetical protein [Trichormus azollae]|uniref:hypothetical protein n=1 Tax=Trichormus azollae TaxID=1164 RepID=UPI00019579B7|nr:hypothetical protein [Trichormus azollae]